MNKRESFKQAANLISGNTQSTGISREELHAELVALQKQSMELSKQIAEAQSNRQLKSPQYFRLLGDKKDLGIRILAIQTKMSAIRREASKVHLNNGAPTQSDWDSFYRVVKFIQNQNGSRS